MKYADALKQVPDLGRLGEVFYSNVLLASGSAYYNVEMLMREVPLILEAISNFDIKLIESGITTKFTSEMLAYIMPSGTFGTRVGGGEVIFYRKLNELSSELCLNPELTNIVTANLNQATFTYLIRQSIFPTRNNVKVYDLLKENNEDIKKNPALCKILFDIFSKKITYCLGPDYAEQPKIIAKTIIKNAAHLEKNNANNISEVALTSRGKELKVVFKNGQHLVFKSPTPVVSSSAAPASAMDSEVVDYPPRAVDTSILSMNSGDLEPAKATILARADGCDSNPVLLELPPLSPELPGGLNWQDFDFSGPRLDLSVENPSTRNTQSLLESADLNNSGLLPLTLTPDQEGYLFSNASLPGSNPEKIDAINFLGLAYQNLQGQPPAKKSRTK